MSPLGVMAPDAKAAAAAAIGWAVMGVDGCVVVLAASCSSRTSLMDEPREDGRET